MPSDRSIPAAVWLKEVRPLSDRLVLVSDLHLGAGAKAGSGPGFADQFDGDQAFPSFLSWLTAGPRSPRRLVLLGDTVDFLRVPVAGALYARNDSEAVRQLDQVVAAHPRVFAALSAALEQGVGIDIVIGNHDVELARPAVQRRLRALLTPPGDSDGEAIDFHLWGYHVPGLLYAEHGNHYHDINSFRRPLLPFLDGRTERPPAARYGSARRLILHGGRWQLPLRQVVRDLVWARKPNGAAVEEYREQVLPRYAAEIGLPRSAVHQLHELGATSVPSIALRVARARLAGGPSFWEKTPEVAAAIHRVLATAGYPVPFCVFGHTHVACRVRRDAPGEYLNTGTWSTDYRRVAPGRPSVPNPPRRTWVEVTAGGSKGPQASLWAWSQTPTELLPWQVVRR
jgi:UDP-2,3-diacylglucosamine pyrophosphatase LpxH